MIYPLEDGRLLFRHSGVVHIAEMKKLHEKVSFESSSILTRKYSIIVHQEASK